MKYKLTELAKHNFVCHDNAKSDLIGKNVDLLWAIVYCDICETNCV